MNEYSIEGKNQPTYTVVPNLSAAQVQESFIANQSLTQLVTLSTYGALFNNPSNSGKNIHINTLFIYSSTDLSLLGSMGIYKGGNFTSPTPSPTAFNIINTQVGSSNTGIASIGSKNNLTILGNPLTNIQLIEDISSNTYYKAIYQGGLVLVPGSSLAIVMSTILSAISNLYIEFRYWEAVL